jgi:hypothetical protein
VHAFAAEVRPGSVTEENRYAPVHSQGSATGKFFFADTGKTLYAADTGNNHCYLQIGRMADVTAQKTFRNSGVPC